VTAVFRDQEGLPSMPSFVSGHEREDFSDDWVCFLQLEVTRGIEKSVTP
jgi:hypothetical protein